MASISRRGPGQWQARVRRNKRVVCKTFGSRLEAERWAADTENILLNGPVPPKAELVRMTFGEALGQYLELITPHKKSRDTETCRIKSLQRSELAELRLVSITGRNMADRMRVYGSRAKDVVEAARAFSREIYRAIVHESGACTGFDASAGVNLH